MSFKLQPLGDRILIEVDEEEETMGKSGLIFRPENARDQPLKGTVVATGEGLMDRDGKLHPPRVNVGDKVMFGMYSGQHIEVGVEKFLIIKDGDLLGILVPEAAE
jgi:chaperonin GroES